MTRPRSRLRRARRARPAHARAAARRWTRRRARSASSTTRGSTEWSSGASNARRIVGASAGSRSRASLGRRRAAAQAERLAERELALELARLVLVAGEQQRAAAHQPHIDAGTRLELGGERRPQLRRAQSELQQAPPCLARTPPPPPARACRRRRVRSPARARRARAPSPTSRARAHATRRASPMMPPPTIATSTRWLVGHADDASPRPLSRQRERHHTAATWRGAWQTPSMQTDADAAQPPRSARRERLAAARLYMVCGADPDGSELPTLLRAAIAGGVEIVQLREKHLPDEELASVAIATRILCEQLGALLIVNDRPWVAREAGADGVHVGQDDMPVAELRELVGPEMLIGLSTHAPEEIDARRRERRRLHRRRSRPRRRPPSPAGRPSALELVRYAAAHAPVPFFAIGGLDASNLAAGARRRAPQRVCVLRAIAAAADPQRAAQRAARAAGRAPRRRIMSSARDEQARAALEPLGPRRASTGAAGRGRPSRGLLAVAVIVGAPHHPRPLQPRRLAAGRDLPGGASSPRSRSGMYRRRYWAVLGFEALLAFQIIVTSLALIVASTLARGRRVRARASASGAGCSGSSFASWDASRRANSSGFDRLSARWLRAPTTAS